MTKEILSPDQPYTEFIQKTEGLTEPTRIPVTITIPNPAVSPARMYQGLRREKGFLLESMEGVPRRAVRSIIGTGIERLITIDDNEDQSIDPIGEIRRIMADERTSERTPAGFAGGLVGYSSYDMVTHLNSGHLKAGKEDQCPIARFMFVDNGVVMDHQAGTCTVFVTPRVCPEDDKELVYTIAAQQVVTLASEVLQIRDEPMPKNEEKIPVASLAVSSSMTKETFETAVKQTLEHIRAGDIFQAVISRRFETPYTGDPFRIYTEVRELNPSPYLYFMEFGDECYCN